MERAAAWRGLVLFGVLTAVCSALVQAWIIGSGRPIEELGLAILLLMWIPGLASVVTRLVLREGFADVSFRLSGGPGRRVLGLAWIYPLPIGLAAYGLAWGLGLAPFAAAPVTKLGLGLGSDGARFAVRVGVSLLILTPIGMLSAMGEELGWRGYLLPRLVQAGVPRPLLVSGLAWGAWHLPLILSGQYVRGPVPVLTVSGFLVGVTAFAFLLGWMRLRTGSLWPAVVGHASWNAIIQGAFDRSTPAPSIWVGEGGILTTLANVILVAVILMVASRRPDREPMERFS
jgi:uncharacterized protein